MATLSALQTEVEAYGFSASAYATRIATWLNEAQRNIARKLDLPIEEQDQTLVLVNGTNTYALSATFQRLMYVVNDTSDQVLQPIEEVEAESLDHNERGTAAYYFVSKGTSLVLYPTPGPGNVTDSLRIHYIGLPAAMSAAGDSSGFPSDYDSALKAYALQEAYAAEDDAQMSAFWNSRYLSRLVDMGEDMNYPDASGPKQVPGAWNF